MLVSHHATVEAQIPEIVSVDGNVGRRMIGIPDLAEIHAVHVVLDKGTTEIHAAHVAHVILEWLAEIHTIHVVPDEFADLLRLLRILGLLGILGLAGVLCLCGVLGLVGKLGLLGELSLLGILEGKLCRLRGAVDSQHLVLEVVGALGLVGWGTHNVHGVSVREEGIVEDWAVNV